METIKKIFGREEEGANPTSAFPDPSASTLSTTKPLFSGGSSQREVLGKTPEQLKEERRAEKTDVDNYAFHMMNSGDKNIAHMDTKTGHESESRHDRKDPARVTEVLEGGAPLSERGYNARGTMETKGMHDPYWGIKTLAKQKSDN